MSTTTRPALRDCPACHGNGMVAAGPYRPERPCPHGHFDELAALRAAATPAHDTARARLAGRRAFKAGSPRVAPVADYTRPGDGLTLDQPAVRAWYAGWDAANLAAEVPA